MSENTDDIQSIIGREFNLSLFLEEFVFANTKFAPPNSSEIEFADAVIMLGDVLIVFQMKQRSPSDAGDAAAERKWFKDKVLAKATKQIRDTLSYLQRYDEILVANERGHTFNLAAGRYKDIIKIVMYAPGDSLPEDCRRTHCHTSSTAGCIHVVDARDYVGISRTLRVPAEVVEYFRYREEILSRFSAACAALHETAFAGHFIEGAPGTPPTAASAGALWRLVDDENQWDLVPILSGIYGARSPPSDSVDYYPILLEFAKIPRSMWREVKLRLTLCIENVAKDEFVIPYRIAYPPTNCGFVFIPVTSDLSAKADWSETRVEAVKNFTLAHKYDQRLDRCVGVLVAKSGVFFDIQWLFAEFPWEEDAEMQRRLDDNYPFRPVQEGMRYGYFTHDRQK